MEEVKAFMITDSIYEGPNGGPVHHRHVEEAPALTLMGGPGDSMIEAKMWVLDRASSLTSAFNWDHPWVCDIESVTFRIYRDGKLVWKSSLEDLQKKMIAIF